MDILVTAFVFIGIFIILVCLKWKGIIPSSYKLTYFDDKEIILKSWSLQERILWVDVTAIFANFSFKARNHCTNFIFELTESGYITFFVEPNYSHDKNVNNIGIKKYLCYLKESFLHQQKLRSKVKTLEKLYDCFLKNLRKKVDITNVEFSHPPRWIKSKRRLSKMRYIGFPSGALLMVLIGLELKGYGPYIFSLPFVFWVVISTISTWLYNRKNKGLLSLKVSDANITWQDQYHYSGTRNISDIISFNLEKTEGSIQFLGGRKLTNLEELRYWPILREYLLSKLEPENAQEK